MNSKKNILCVVEGEVTEIEIFKSLFMQLGYEIVSRTKNGNFQHIVYDDNKSRLYLVPGKHPQVTSELANLENIDIHKLYCINEKYVAYTFIVYDFDSAKGNYLLDKYKNKFNSEDEGLLIVSSPCIESIVDTRTSSRDYNDKPSKYKDDVLTLNNIVLDNNSNIIDYINKNIFDLLIKQLEYNASTFETKDIFEHINCAYKKAEDNNVDINTGNYDYKAIFTLLYVIVAFARDILPKSGEPYEDLLKELIHLRDSTNIQEEKLTA